MGFSIDERVCKLNTYYRVRFRKSHKNLFSITFDDRKSAVEWVENNEKDFEENLDRHIKWKHNLFQSMRRKGERSRNGIKKTYFRSKE